MLAYDEVDWSAVPGSFLIGFLFAIAAGAWALLPVLLLWPMRKTVAALREAIAYYQGMAELVKSGLYPSLP